MEFKKIVSDQIYNKIDDAKSISDIYPNKAINLSKEAYKLAEVNELEIEKGYALIAIALASRVKSDVINMLESSYKAFSIFKAQSHIIGQAKALNLIGVAYFYSSMYEEALNYFLEANSLVKFNNDTSLLISTLNNIGEVYRELEIYGKSIEYYEKAIDIINQNNYDLSHATILGNIGEIYFAKKEFIKALNVYNKSYDILQNSTNIVSLGEIENRIGKIHFIMKEFKKAENYYFKSLNRLEGVKNKYYVIDVLINIAQMYIEKSSEKALGFYKKAIDFSQEVGSKKKLSKVYRLISEYHEVQGDYKKALEYYKKYSITKEEVMSLNLRNKLEILNIDFRNIETTGKINNIRIRLENEITRQKNELEKIKRANEMLEKKAYEDELTGIKNRRSINIYLNRMMEKVSLSKDTIALFMIDIDNFKRYNDYWGHSEGDNCIKKIADCIKKIQESREDTFGRYGGEEFVYISTPTTYEDALVLGNLIRTEVENIGLYYIYNGERKTITISVGGVIGNCLDLNSIPQMMELADKELYRAKDMGRNITFLRNMNENKQLSFN